MRSHTDRTLINNPVCHIPQKKKSHVKLQQESLV